MMVVMVVLVVVLEVLEGMVRLDGGMVPTTAQHLREGVNVMSVITWWRPLPSSLHTSIGGLQFMVTMFTSQLPRGIS